MQTFYNKLSAAKSHDTTYLSWLARLTEASRTDMVAWQNTFAWGAWDR